MPDKHLCIHGHFYQPPREDPWLDKIFPEGSAAPFRHWNERICRESYAPLAWARRMDGEGRITELINCYEWISFNVGPTLFNWFERSQPELCTMLQEADRRSLKRWGHGNAIAQVYHHVIMPLASELDKEIEVSWAIADFESRFNRRPEGMWLAETACDTASLEVLADHGIEFTLLAPRQAEAIAKIGSDEWTAVDEYSLDIRRPYLVELPSGRTISIFFYDGGLSQAVAFEGLLRDGENFWNRLSGVADAGGGLLSIGTDGETYGHHFEFGEMALAYVLSQGINNRDDISLLNYGAYLEKNPPEYKVRIRESSSWSCYHGVERWRSDCGCSTGGHPSWNQKWRKPLREALQRNKEAMDAYFFSEGISIFNDPRKALLEYGKVLSGLVSEDDFFKLNFKKEAGTEGRDKGWALLSMQKWALASFASCGWFFDDLARLEPVNNMTFALRSIEIADRIGLEGLERAFRSVMAEAYSNEERYGSGADIWENMIKTGSESPASLVAQAVSRMTAEGGLPSPGEEGSVIWPGVTVRINVDSGSDGTTISGSADIQWNLESKVREYSWRWGKGPCLCAGELEIGTDKNGEFERFDFGKLPWKKRQSISLAWLKRSGESIWQRKLLEWRSACSLFLPYEDYQTVQTWSEKWRELWSVLVFSHVFSPGYKAESDMLEFISQEKCEHPDAEMVAMRICDEFCRELEENTPDWEYVRGALLRLGKTGLSVNFWDVQNRYWLHREKGTADESVGRLIGF